MSSFRSLILLAITSTATAAAQQTDRLSWNCMRRQMTACELGSKTTALVGLTVQRFFPKQTFLHTSSVYDSEEISPLDVVVESVVVDKSGSLKPGRLRVHVSGPVSESGWAGDGFLPHAREKRAYMLLTLDGEHWILRMHGYFWQKKSGSFENEGGLVLTESELLNQASSGLKGSSCAK